EPREPAVRLRKCTRTPDLWKVAFWPWLASFTQSHLQQALCPIRNLEIPREYGSRQGKSARIEGFGIPPTDRRFLHPKLYVPHPHSLDARASSGRCGDRGRGDFSAGSAREDASRISGRRCPSTSGRSRRCTG